MAALPEVYVGKPGGNHEQTSDAKNDDRHDSDAKKWKTGPYSAVVKDDYMANDF